MGGRYASGSTSTAGSIEPVTPNDSANLTHGRCRALWIGVAGNIDIWDGSGQPRTGIPVQVGIFPIEVTRVLTTSTASNIWAIY